MKIRRTIPPTAAPLDWTDVWGGLSGVFSRERSGQNLEEEMKELFAARSVFAVSSGKAAFALILRALSALSPKKEVIIPAYTCFSVPSAILKVGLKVKLCDLDPSTLDFDYKSLEEIVGENTLCVVASHLFGRPSNLDRINALCRFRGIYVVEDAAQAMGGTYQGRPVGALGDAGFFSFGRGKNLTCGSGGLILTNSAPIAAMIGKYYSGLETPGFSESFGEFLKLFLMKVFIHPALFWFPEGLAFLKLGETFFYEDFPIKRLSRLKRGWLRTWKRRLEASNGDRARNASYFIKALNAKTPREGGYPYLRLPVLMDSQEQRNRLHTRSKEWGLGLSIMYPSPIHEIKEISAQFRGEEYPLAKEIAARLLAVPTHSFLSEGDKRAIADLINGRVALARD